MLLIVADLIARTIIAPAELPAGILTSLVGAPVFFYLLVKSKSLNNPERL
jgi:iron complex transport system permease protein